MYTLCVTAPVQLPACYSTCSVTCVLQHLFSYLCVTAPVQLPVCYSTCSVTCVLQHCSVTCVLQHLFSYLCVTAPVQLPVYYSTCSVTCVFAYAALLIWTTICLLSSYLNTFNSTIQWLSALHLAVFSAFKLFFGVRKALHPVRYTAPLWWSS